MSQRRRTIVLALCGAAVAAVLPSTTLAQAPGVTIEPKRLPPNGTPEVLDKLNALRVAGELMSLDDARDALASPTPAKVELPPRLAEPMRPSAIAARLHRSALRVVWYHLCNRCDNWHLNTAGGYALTSDGVGVTCHHVMMPSRDRMREGYLVAIDYRGNAYPITAVLAADRQLDAVVFRMKGATDLVPLPINDQGVPGDPVYLLSDPSGVSGYFSEGIINRFYWEGTKSSGDPTQLRDARHLRMDVSADWSPGSSGSPLVDECGNVVGHVSKISTLMSPGGEDQQPPRQAPDARSGTSRPATAPNGATQPAVAPMPNPRVPGTLVVLHDATPIRGVRLMIDAMNAGPASTQPTLAPAADAGHDAPE